MMFLLIKANNQRDRYVELETFQTTLHPICIILNIETIPGDTVLVRRD